MKRIIFILFFIASYAFAEKCNLESYNYYKVICVDGEKFLVYSRWKQGGIAPFILNPKCSCINK
jgi:hypothetical protein